MALDDLVAQYQSLPTWAQIGIPIGGVGVVALIALHKPSSSGDIISGGGTSTGGSNPGGDTGAGTPPPQQPTPPPPPVITQPPSKPPDQTPPDYPQAPPPILPPQTPTITPNPNLGAYGSQINAANVGTLYGQLPAAYKNAYSGFINGPYAGQQQIGTDVVPGWTGPGTQLQLGQAAAVTQYQSDFAAGGVNVNAFTTSTGIAAQFAQGSQKQALTDPAIIAQYQPIPASGVASLAAAYALTHPNAAPSASQQSRWLSQPIANNFIS